MKTIIASRRIWRIIAKFYINAILKYKTYTISEAITDARKAMEGGLVPSSKKLDLWVKKNYIVFRSRKLNWYFACVQRKDGNYEVKDVENYRNMSDLAFHRGGSPTLPYENPTISTPMQLNTTDKTTNYHNLPYKCKKVGNAGFDCNIIERFDGKQTYVDKNDNLLKNIWFDKVLPFKRSPKGPWGYVKCGDDCYAFMLSSRDVLDMNVKWENRICEKKSFPVDIECLINEAINEMCRRKMLSESFIHDKPFTLDEDDLKGLIRLVLTRQSAIMESKVYQGYLPIGYDKEIVLDSGNKIKSLVTISDGAGRYDIGEDDGCYVVYKDKQNKNPMYIFPELHRELKKLPNLPLR